MLHSMHDMHEMHNLQLGTCVAAIGCHHYGCLMLLPQLSDAIVERERKHRERIKAKKTNNPRTRRSRPRTPRQCLVDETANTGAGATEAKVNEASQISRDKLHGNGGDELHGNGGDALLADAGQPRQLGQAEKQPTPQEGIEHQPEV